MEFVIVVLYNIKYLIFFLTSSILEVDYYDDRYSMNLTEISHQDK